MAEPSPEFPQRLVDSEGSASQLIRGALAEPLSGPSESRSWQRLRERPATGPQRFRLAFAVSGACLLALLFYLHAAGSEPAPSVVAEVWTRTPIANSSRPVASVASREPTERAPAKLERAPNPKPEPRSVEAHGDPTRCAGLAREGSFEAAAACYDRIAHGRSMSAELALYEKARLESKALGRGEAALATLEEHGRRFRTGVLATEVAITRIELLIRLRRTDSALAALDQALAGPPGRERGGDLLALRGDLLASRGDCQAALEALAGARKAGVHASRLEAGEKRCADAQ